MNSGNVIFSSSDQQLGHLANLISKKLEKTFGFPVPAILKKSNTINQLLKAQPFQGVKFDENTRFYVSFLKNNIQPDLTIPWESPDQAFKIIEKSNNTIFSVLDLSMTKTLKSMHNLEKYYGKDITTRNWKTIKRIGEKLKPMVK